jgi:hypothetical protein
MLLYGLIKKKKLEYCKIGIKMALCVGLNAEHGALLVPPAGDLVEEHQLLHVTRRGYPSRQVGLKYTCYKT